VNFFQYKKKKRRRIKEEEEEEDTDNLGCGTSGFFSLTTTGCR